MATRKARPALPHSESVSAKIRTVIAARNLTAYAIAEESGVDASIITRFLNDPNRSVTSKTLDKVATALGLSIVEGRKGLGLSDRRSRRVDANERVS